MTEVSIVNIVLGLGYKYKAKKKLVVIITTSFLLK